jgi:hypothetical protein
VGNGRTNLRPQEKINIMPLAIHVIISSCANRIFQAWEIARELATGAMAFDRPREGGNSVGNSAITYNVVELSVVL